MKDIDKKLIENNYVIKTYKPLLKERIVFSIVDSLPIGRVSYILNKKISNRTIERYIRNLYREEFSTQYFMSLYKENLIDMNILMTRENKIYPRKIKYTMKNDPISYMKNFSISPLLSDKTLSDNISKRYYHYFNRLVSAEDLKKNNFNKNQLSDNRSEFDKMFDEATDNAIDAMVANTYDFQANPKFFVSVMQSIIDELNKKERKTIVAFTHIIELD